MAVTTKKGSAATDLLTLESIHSTTSTSNSSALRPLMDEKTSQAHMAKPGEKSRPATMSDVIVDRGEFWGDGVPRTAGWHPYEPLDWNGTEVLA